MKILRISKFDKIFLYGLLSFVIPVLLIILIFVNVMIDENNIPKQNQPILVDSTIYSPPIDSVPPKREKKPKKSKILTSVVDSTQTSIVSQNISESNQTISKKDSLVN